MTFIMHITGKSVGRERGLQPMPVEDHAAAEAAIMTLGLRALPLAHGHRVDWIDDRRAKLVIPMTSGPDFVAGRFTLKDA